VFGFSTGHESVWGKFWLRGIFSGLEQHLSFQLSNLKTMLTFILWCILFILCWPIALAALILYPFIWLLLLPFRLLGFAVELSFDLVRNIFMLPFRVLGVK
jgi:hypothetical protein